MIKPFSKNNTQILAANCLGIKLHRRCFSELLIHMSRPLLKVSISVAVTDRSLVEANGSQVQQNPSK